MEFAYGSLAQDVTAYRKLDSSKDYVQSFWVSGFKAQLPGLK